MGSEELLLEAGKSSELSAALHTVSECEIDGTEKFSPLICREIGKIIVCRTYATPLMELCHLIVCANDLAPDQGRYEYFFWDSGVAQPANFRHYCTRVIKERPTERLTLDKTGIKLHYSDGTFCIQFSRMPVLSALMEFLLTSLGYCEIDDILQNMLANEPDKKSVSKSANALSRLVYAYLRNHLPTAQSQRKFRKILAFCNDDISNANDQTILEFWQSASLEQDKSVDFRTYDSVLSTFIRAIQAVETARDLAALNHANPIGGEHDAGEISPDILSETLDSVAEPLSPLLQLSAPPTDRIKFLNKQETGHLDSLLNAGKLALRLPLSILRTNVFTKQQSRLTQALRRHLDPDQLNALIRDEPEETYQTRQTTYQNLRKHIARSIYASLHALAQARSKEVISIMLKLEPDIDFTPLARHFPSNTREQPHNVITLQGEKFSDHFMQTIQAYDNVGDEIAKLMEKAQNAYDGLSRKGFKEDIVQNPDLSDAFSKGADLLLDIAREIDAFLNQLERLNLNADDWSEQFAQDHHIFCTQFEKIYAEA